ncbi:hypothetical protein BKK79_00835 [Cupriavidus sp. USMAA2-4]|uniref:hypothetical protein n=1 Tax=Cupriavidus sp. USMAA2-4 TaxID=876364 RepID=UPI0008A6D00F|nr:hypothetical protein [Cupriavidus sp. USMAA2-4]AOY90533.1 hypothetical protein BKK79_00835 [Cupriavidus sp. USMAA2-4]
MEQIMSRTQIREEGALAARAGKQGASNPYPEGTEARKEWDRGFILDRRAAQALRIATAAVVSKGMARRVA